MALHSGLPATFLDGSDSSFSTFLKRNAPDLLPSAPDVANSAGVNPDSLAPHGTTIVAAMFEGGVVMAGDRRATMGNVIAQRDINKVFSADEFTAVGIAGSAGLAVDLVRLFQVELEHYEKIEGTSLSLEGKANRLATMLRGNLGLAMQGLAAVPLLAGFDTARGIGRIFSYDVTGGRYEEHEFHAIGSGSYFARGSLKKLHESTQDRDQVVQVCLQALYDAADDDSATGGPDLNRRIFPVVVSVTADGFHRVNESDLSDAVELMITGRARRPDGPLARVGGN